MAEEFSSFALATNSLGTLNPLSIWKTIKLTKKILKFIGEIPEWINYNNHLERQLLNLRRRANCLEAAKSDIKTQLENTELQTGRKRKREVDHWLRIVKKKEADVKIIEKNISSVSYLPRFLFRAWLESRILQEIQQVNELHEQGKFPGGLLLDGPRNGSGCDPFVTARLVGRVAEEKLDEIWAHIINPNTTRVGVQGLEGIGKSALMGQVYNRLCSCYGVYYVNFPQSFTLCNLQAAIASELKMELPLHDGSEARRASRIFRVLKYSMKEFVLIFDGVSQDFCLEDVGIPSEANGMKMVIASRSSDVCRRMSCQEMVVLERLSRDDSESLFMEKLAPCTSISEEMRCVAKEIVAKCDGIPSRIVTMAVQLRGVSDINEWRDILNEM